MPLTLNEVKNNNKVRRGEKMKTAKSNIHCGGMLTILILASASVVSGSQLLIVNDKPAKPTTKIVAILSRL
jgi:hypothetical protein